MENILIIGNGFDIYHKLPTRYTDFLFLVKNWHTFEEQYNSSRLDTKGKIGNEDLKFTVRLDEKGRLSRESLDDFGNHAKSFDDDQIKQLKKIIEANIWIKYFVKINYNKEGWIDFESEIELVLCSLENIFSSRLKECNGRTAAEILSPIELSIFNFLTEALGLERPPVDIWTKKFIDDYMYGGKEKDILEALKEDLIKLTTALEIYLDQFVGHIDSELFSNQIEKIGPIHVINFNYTNTYKAVYGDDMLLGQHHVHGALHEDNVVLGIGDDKITNLDYVYFFKYFQRIQKKTGSHYKEWLKSPISGYKIYIMGHSLGMTDKTILNTIFKEQKIASEIVIFYHSPKGYEDLVIALINLFGKEYVIDKIGEGYIKFLELEKPLDRKVAEEALSLAFSIQ